MYKWTMCKEHCPKLRGLPRGKGRCVGIQESKTHISVSVSSYGIDIKERLDLDDIFITELHL